MVAKIVTTLSTWNNASSKTIGGAALLIAFSGILSRLLGFFRDRILATQFGAGDILDAYYTAFRIPDLLYGLLIAGALSAAFVPIFTELTTNKKDGEAWRLTSGLLMLLLASLGALAFLGNLFAPGLTDLLAPGFDEEKLALAAGLTRVMLLSPILLGISAVFGGVLMSFKRFVAYSLAPIFYNLGIIFGAVALTPLMGPVGLAWGVVLGAFLHMAIQYPALRATGFRFVPGTLSVWREKPARRVMALMIPRSLSMGVSQVSLLAMTAFASTLASGSLAAFTFANNIQSVPLGLFGIAFALAVFPSLSIYAAEKNGTKFFDALCGTTQRILFFVVPLSFAMVIFRAQFVRVILGAGQFDWEDTILTFEVMKFLAMSLFAQSLIPLFARAFFALKNTKTPLYIALISEALHIALIPLLLPYFAVEALAIAFSAGALVNAGLLYWYLRREAAFWRDRAFFKPATKIFAASLMAGLIAQLSKTAFALTTNELDTFIEVFLQLVTGLLIGGVSYVFFAYAFGIHELDMVGRFIRHRLLRRPEAAVLTEDHPERGDW
jgi:putative peptidoglycan lipid II flippase